MRGSSRSDYSATEDDNVIVQGVSGERGGLGYFGLSYYLENQSRLKLLGVDGGSGLHRSRRIKHACRAKTLQAALAAALHLREARLVPHGGRGARSSASR